MPFDSEPPAEVTARDMIMRLRDFLADLPDAKFDIRRIFTGPADSLDGIDTAARFNECGTAACVAGWARVLFGDDNTRTDFGLPEDDYRALIMPPDYFMRHEIYTRAAAVDTLTRLLETGKVEWRV